MKNNKFLVTGGAGFIGSNLVSKLLHLGHQVTIYDNLSRKNVEVNIKLLEAIAKRYGRLKVEVADIRDIKKLKQTLPGHDVIFHLAAQVAVTDSVVDPVEDFDINLQGTFNILETIRNYSAESILVYSSTNKVYGDLESLNIEEKKTRYQFADKDFQNGISETQPLDFHSPYACSKGAADQYIHDYNRIYNLKTVVLRQSCIYGIRQFGSEAQGWLFHFLKSAIQNRKINIFGTGKQVRDVLFIEDLIELYLKIVKKINKTQGKIYNVGGGVENALSLLESIDLIKNLTKKPVTLNFHEPRSGDQKIFISDNEKIEKDTGWKPKIDYNKGLYALEKWVETVIKMEK